MKNRIGWWGRKFERRNGRTPQTRHIAKQAIHWHRCADVRVNGVLANSASRGNESGKKGLFTCQVQSLILTGAGGSHGHQSPWAKDAVVCTLFRPAYCIWTGILHMCFFLCFLPSKPVNIINLGCMQFPISSSHPHKKALQGPSN